MIYLITGSPGTGKTAMVMSWIKSNKFGLFKDDYGSPRPVFTVNIEILDKRYFPGVVETPKEELISGPLDAVFPDGSVIIVDEASEVYPSRSMAAKLPVHLERLNTLRHHGLTLILLTQAPSMIDPFVRALVGKHIHVERKHLGSKLYEWNTVQSTFNATSFGLAYAVPYKPNKEVFGKYKSATQHIKFKKSVPWYYKALLVLPFLLGGLVWFANSRINSLGGETEEKTGVEKLADAPKDVDTGLKRLAGDGNQNRAASDYVPTVPTMEETKPIYNSVRRVEDFPVIVGCFENISAKTCRCYTQQATVAEGISFGDCRERVKNPSFNPYRKRNVDDNKAQHDVVPAAVESRPSVAVMGGKTPVNLMYDVPPRDSNHGSVVGSGA